MSFLALVPLLAILVGLMACHIVTIQPATTPPSITPPSTPPSTTPPSTVPGCYYQKKTYKPGQIFGDVCNPCSCMKDGSVFCWSIACAVVYCVDAVHDNTKCCPVCPNVRNCKATDGTVIKEGDIYHLDDHTTCYCPVHLFGFGPIGGQKAECIVVSQPGHV